MPYATNAMLPRAIRDHLPSHAQDIFRAAFNRAFSEHHDESRAFRIAWAAVERVYEKLNDQWVPRDRDW